MVKDWIDVKKKLLTSGFPSAWRIPRMLCYQKEFVSPEPRHMTTPEGATSVGLSRRVPFSLPSEKRKRAWQKEKAKEMPWELMVSGQQGSP